MCMISGLAWWYGVITVNVILIYTVYVSLWATLTQLLYNIKGLWMVMIHMENNYPLVN